MRNALLVLLGVVIATVAYAQINPFTNQGAGATVSAYRILDVTPSDTCNDQFGQPNRAVWVGGAGDLRIKTYGGDTRTIVGITAGSLLPIVVACVYSTSTTATSIQVWW